MKWLRWPGAPPAAGDRARRPAGARLPLRVRLRSGPDPPRAARRRGRAPAALAGGAVRPPGRGALGRDAEGVTVRDVGVSPTLTVTGERVNGSRALRDGDVLVLGTTSLRYHDPAEVYLRRLETPGTPDESEPPPAPPPRAVR